MANEKEPEPGTRGFRINEIRKRLRLSREGFADALAAVASASGLDAGGKWTPTRVSNTVLNKKPIPLDDAAAIILLAEAEGLDGVSWNWLVFGELRAEAISHDRVSPVVKTGVKVGAKRQVK
jgi:hypothetical protein